MNQKNQQMGIQLNLTTVKEIADRLIADLHPFCERAEIAGSVRRLKPNPKDLELVCIPKRIVQLGMFDSTEELQPVQGFIDVINKFKKVKGTPAGKYTQRILPEGIKLDLFMANVNNWGYVMAQRTGSSSFSHKLAIRWQQMGYTGVGGYLTKDGKVIPVREELELFDLLQLQWIEPRERNEEKAKAISTFRCSEKNSQEA